MSGHELLDSCHHCGRSGVHLTLAYSTPHVAECKESHHIHVIAACDDCWRAIWKRPGSCQRCGSERLLDVSGKSSDLNDFIFGGRNLEERYVISGCNIGAYDYYSFVLCLDCGQMQGKWPVPRLEVEEARLWFFVPDYPAVREALEEAYGIYGVEEHSAEPGRTRGNPDDADVTVKGPASKVADFRAWLEDGPVIPGLQIEGERIDG